MTQRVERRVRARLHGTDRQRTSRCPNRSFAPSGGEHPGEPAWRSTEPRSKAASDDRGRSLHRSSCPRGEAPLGDVHLGPPEARDFALATAGQREQTHCPHELCVRSRGLGSRQRLAEQRELVAAKVAVERPGLELLHPARRVLLKEAALDAPRQGGSEVLAHARRDSAPAAHDDPALRLGFAHQGTSGPAVRDVLL